MFPWFSGFSFEHFSFFPVRVPLPDEQPVTAEEQIGEQHSHDVVRSLTSLSASNGERD
jgi:hypothetical protein